MKKQWAALAAALLMTACVGIAILAIGGVAMFNQSGVAPANSVSQASKFANASITQQTDLQQLQAQLAQYQQRDQQYQAREQQLQKALSQAQGQVQQAQAQMQQIQMLLAALQQRGIITIGSDGSIFINR
jgi:septal ring factor EnvC (AmiA/AmiB activator)